MQYPTNARVIRVMCTGRVNEGFIEHAFDKGAGMVLVAGCHEGDCHYIHGNKFMTRREKRIREMMQEKGIADHRFRLEWISASEGLSSSSGHLDEHPSLVLHYAAILYADFWKKLINQFYFHTLIKKEINAHLTK